MKTNWLFIFIIFAITLGVCVIASLGFFDYQLSQKELLVSLQANADANLINISQQQKQEQEKTVSLAAVGDIMLSRYVNAQMEKYGDDYPFLKTRDYLLSSDIVFGNLETSITTGTIPLSTMLFRARPGVEKELKNSNFTVLSLANNHVPNYGSLAVMDTIDYLNVANIKPVGAGSNEINAYFPVFVERQGIIFAFFAYNDNDVVPESYKATANNPGTAFMDIEKMKQSVAIADKIADHVIVSMHSGNEYEEIASSRQREFAHAAIEAGADLVIGHHAHVVQQAEVYKGKYIFYSLGNFIFDQEWSKDTKQGLITKFFFNKKELRNIELRPIIISDYCQPDFADGQTGADILKRLDIDLTSQIFMGK